MKDALKKLNSILSWVLLIAALLLFVTTAYQVYTAKDTSEDAFIFGYRPVYVLTGSMEPYMEVNGMCLTKKVDSLDEIKVNDVVTYHVNTTEGKTVRITHRIMDINENGIITTKGDNNKVIDAYPLTIDNIDSKVVAVFNQTAWIVANPVISACFALAIVLLIFAVSFFFKGSEEDDEADEAKETSKAEICVNLLSESKDNDKNETAETISDK